MRTPSEPTIRITLLPVGLNRGGDHAFTLNPMLIVSIVSLQP